MKFSKTIIVLAFSFITIAMFADFIFSDKMITSTDQVAAFGDRVYFKHSLTKLGQFPMWNSSKLSGMPTVDALFGDAMYPPALLLKVLLPIHKAFVIKMILHIFIAGLLFYLMMRQGFGTSKLVAFTGAVFYMLNPEFFSHVYPGHDAKMYVIALLPFTVWRMKLLMETPNFINATFLAFSVGISIITSHVQLSYFVLWGLFFYWCMSIGLNWFKNKDFKLLIRPIGFFWLSIFIGLGIAIVQLLPAMMYVQEEFSVRGVERGFDYAASWSLHWPELFSLWVPEFVNTLGDYWGENYFKLNSEYVGAMAMIFSIFAIVTKPKDPWRIFWLAVAVFALLFSLGKHTPIFHIAYYIVPGVKKFRACSMIMMWFSFPIILLATLFLRDLTDRAILSKLDDKKTKKWNNGLLITIGVATVIALLFSLKGFTQGVINITTPILSDQNKFDSFNRNFSTNFVPALWLWWFWVVSAIGLTIALINKKITNTIFLLAILLIGLVDLARIDRKFVQVTTPKPYFYVEPELKKLQIEMKKEPFRVFLLPGTYRQQNAAGIYGLEEIGGFHDNELKWYRAFRGEQGSFTGINYLRSIVGQNDNGGFYLIQNALLGNPFLNLANAKYLIQRINGRLQVVKNSGALPRLSFVTDYLVAKESKIPEILSSGKHDYKKRIIFLEEPDKRPVHSSDTSFKANLQTEWKIYTPNKRVVKINVNADGYLRLSEVYYPGWKIKVDNKISKIYRADLTWMAIYLTKGEHLVEMYPHSLYAGKSAIVSFSIVLLLIIFWAYNFKKKRTKDLHRD